MSIEIIDTCARCGRVHKRCSAHNRQGGPCGRWPMRDQRVCDHHGGKSPKALAGAERRRTRERALGQLGALVEQVAEEWPEKHPVDELVGSVRRASVMTRALETMTAELDAPLVSNRFGEQVVHPLVVLLREWADLLAKHSKLAIDAGLEERLLELETAKAAVMFEAVLGGLADIGLSMDVIEAARPAIANRLRALDAEATP